MSVDPSAVAAELRPPTRIIDLVTPRSVHIVGIGGAGMRALARVLIAMGHTVSGSDAVPSHHLESLSALGATVFVGHTGDQVGTADLVTRSTAIGDDNPEVQAALRSGIDVTSRAEILAAMTDRRPGVLVAGTHGKTTTSSLLAVLLDHAGLDPSFVVGSDIDRFGTGARWGTSDHFVVEADESDGTFLALRGAHAIVTSVDPDHLEFYGTPSRLDAAFRAFVDGIEGAVAVCIDDPDTAPLVGRSGVITYGTTETADLRLLDVRVSAATTEFDVEWRGEHRGRVTVALPGMHNALNAAGALTIALHLGVPFDVAADGVAAFNGVSRRFEYRGEVGGVRFVDDYAHLPAEVEAAIGAAQAGPWNRVIAAYQPHRYSRTQALAATFAESFSGVDRLVLTDIYASGEAPRPGVTGRMVLDAVTAACPDLAVSWQATLDDVTDHLGEILGPGDLCLTLGAGDLTTVPDRVIERLASRSPASIEWLHRVEVELAATTVHYNAPIGPLTTYRVGGAALALAEVGSLDDLRLLIDGAARNDTPILALGNGSNLLVADRGFMGVAIRLGVGFDSIVIDGTEVKLGAAVSLPRAARRTVQHSLTGFEWAVGVPGTVGGAIVMNAGGHGSDMAATTVSATVLNTETRALEERSAEVLDFGYRTSNLTGDEIVVAATLRLQPGDRDTGERTIGEIVRWRRENQPGGQNAGSVFTNPEGESAGRLIDEAGLKGFRLGSAEVSAKHANFIQVDAGGSAGDVRALMGHVIDVVRETSGFELVPETRMVGFHER